MKEIVRRRNASSKHYKYSWYDLKLDLLTNVSWSSYNYLRKYRFNDDYGGDITMPYYSDYPYMKLGDKGHPYSNRYYSFNYVVVTWSI